MESGVVIGTSARVQELRDPGAEPARFPRFRVYDEKVADRMGEETDQVDRQHDAFDFRDETGIGLHHARPHDA